MEQFDPMDKVDIEVEKEEYIMEKINIKHLKNLFLQV